MYKPRLATAVMRWFVERIWLEGSSRKSSSAAKATAAQAVMARAEFLIKRIRVMNIEAFKLNGHQITRDGDIDFDSKTHDRPLQPLDRILHILESENIKADFRVPGAPGIPSRHMN
jgi:hypothetical protein